MVGKLLFKLDFLNKQETYSQKKTYTVHIMHLDEVFQATQNFRCHTSNLVFDKIDLEKSYAS